MPHQIISHAEAVAKGLKHFFTGKPCKRGHVDLRFVSTWKCMTCARLSTNERRKANPEHRKELERRSRERNRDKLIARERAARAADPERFRANDKRSYEKNRSKRIAKTLRWRAENPEKYEAYRKSQSAIESIRRGVKKWREANRDAINAYRRARAESDVGFRIRINLAGRINQAVRYVWGHKSAKTLELIGCSIEDLRAHLEHQFKPGMTWSNYGYGADKWHIDHVRPCAAFDLTKPSEQRLCFHYSNLQPLWQSENFQKNAGSHKKPKRRIKP